MFIRVEVDDTGMHRDARVGDGWLANPAIVENNTTAAITALASDIQLGIMTIAALTTDQVVKLDTAENILAAIPAMDIGDTHVFTIANLTTNAIAALTTEQGVSYAGLAGLPAITARDLIIEKLSATTVKATAI